MGVFAREEEEEGGEEEEEGPAGRTRRQGGAVAGGGVSRQQREQEEEERLSQKREGEEVELRWSPLLANKRYGGFMRGGDERSQRPLITLFRTVINKEGQEEEGREG